MEKNKALTTILNKMFEIAGYSKTIDDVVNEQDEYWYTNHTMTEEQEEKWLDWSHNYLVSELKWSKKKAKKEMQWVNLTYGLRIIK